MRAYELLPTCARWSRDPRLRTVTALAALILCASALGAQAYPRGHLGSYLVRTRALAGSLLHDSLVQRVEVYTPRSYPRDTTRRYPVLFLLHGIAGTSEDWTKPGYQGLTIQGVMDSLTEVGAVKEMIVVVPTASNAYAGSYYSNSPVGGNWEDYISRELVAWVDSAFRTIPVAASRGIAGHSMGGFGAVIMAMRHSDVFSVAYAMSPCCLAMVGEIGPSNEAWRRMAQFRDAPALQQAAQRGDLYPIAIVGLAAVFSPNPMRPPLYVDLPYVRRGDSIVAVPGVVARWRRAMPVAQVGASKENLSQLRFPIRLDYGFDDQFIHIPPAVRMLADSLGVYHVPYRLDAYVGDHRNQVRTRITTIVLPFFSVALLDRQ
jgi:S-formylglutathione hydrolase FrmB